MKQPETPWAPDHLKPMSCACIHSDAITCMSWRYDTPYDPDNFDCRCDCCCHGRDLDEDEEY